MEWNLTHTPKKVLWTFSLYLNLIARSDIHFSNLYFVCNTLDINSCNKADSFVLPPPPLRYATKYMRHLIRYYVVDSISCWRVKNELHICIKCQGDNDIPENLFFRPCISHEQNWHLHTNHKCTNYYHRSICCKLSNNLTYVHHTLKLCLLQLIKLSLNVSSGFYWDVIMLLLHSFCTHMPGVWVFFVSKACPKMEYVFWRTLEL